MTSSFTTDFIKPHNFCFFTNEGLAHEETAEATIGGAVLFFAMGLIISKASAVP
jgi:hypothetical protein